LDNAFARGHLLSFRTRMAEVAVAVEHIAEETAAVLAERRVLSQV